MAGSLANSSADPHPLTHSKPRLPINPSLTKRALVVSVCSQMMCPQIFYRVGASRDSVALAELVCWCFHPTLLPTGLAYRRAFPRLALICSTTVCHHEDLSSSVKLMVKQAVMHPASFVYLELRLLLMSCINTLIIGSPTQEAPPRSKRLWEQVVFPAI